MEHFRYISYSQLCRTINKKVTKGQKGPKRSSKLIKGSLMVLHFKVISCQLHIYKKKHVTNEISIGPNIKEMFQIG